MYLSVPIVLFQDNGSAKYFQGTRTGINMGEKVAQVTRKAFVKGTSLALFYTFFISLPSDYLLFAEKCPS